METYYTRAQLVSAARGLLGIPFRHQGRSRDGIDCIGMPLCAMLSCCPTLYEKLCERARIEGRTVRVSHAAFYQPTYRVNDESLMIHFLEFVARPKALAAVQPGDLLMFHFNGWKTFTGMACERDGALSLLSCFSMSHRANERHLAGLLRRHWYAAHELRGIV